MATPPAADPKTEAKRAELFRWVRLQVPADMDIEKAVATALADAQVEAAEPVQEWRLADIIDPPIENLPDATTDPDFDVQWHLINARIPQAWNHLNTNGVHAGGLHSVVVAVVDSGVDYTHEDLIGNIWANPAEIPGNGIDDDSNGFIDDVHGCNVVSDGRSHSGDPIDLHGHGTHVAGIIAAQGLNQKGGVGVAFNVQIMGIRAAQYSGTLTTTDIAEAITYATDNGAEVINMSFGGYAYSQLVADALEVALNQAVLVAAAGNDNRNSLTQPPPSYPAAIPWVIGVMSSTPSNTKSWFSNYGPHYQISAPGDSIHSTLPGSRYAAWSGTSMATPVVSGVAALMRSYFWQRDIYSSRFLAASIVGSGSENGGVVDAYVALTTPPKPGVSMLENWVFDDPGIAGDNDGDGRIDAGETVHLGIEMINRGGQADMVISILEARAPGATQDDPYVTIDVPVVDFGGMGPFTTKDNGFVYNQDGVITGVTDPFVVTVDPNTPNDHVINFVLTTHFLDGWNPEEPGPFYRVDQFQYVVQRGRNIPTVIATGTDMELTSDEYWIVGGPVLIEPGASLTVREGTQVQWGAISDDPYNPGPQQGNLVVRGTLTVEGSANRPVSLFPSYLVAGQKTNIQVDGGTADIAYATIRNPWLTAARNLDHVYCDWEYVTSVQVQAESLTNSILHRLRATSGTLDIKTIDTVVFDGGWFGPTAPRFLRNCAFLQDNENIRPLRLDLLATFSRDTVLRYAQQYQGKSYVLMELPCTLTNGFNTNSRHFFQLTYANLIAEYLGGHVVTISDQGEQDFLRSYLQGRPSPAFKCYSSPGVWYGIGMTDDQDHPETLSWINGEPVSYTNWYPGYPFATSGEGTIVYFRPEDGYWSLAEGNKVGDWAPRNLAYILELPGTVTDDDLEDVVTSPALIQYVLERTESPFRGNAFLSPYWDPSISHWMRVGALSHHRYPDLYVPAQQNYWGTDSTVLIDHAIDDYFDTFNSARIVYGEPPVHGDLSTYPFVESVSVAGLPIETVPEVGAGPTTFSITFNRDMDTTIQPYVTFGPSSPYTDFTVHPIDDGWINPRTWEGTFWITPVTGEGYHLMRISGAVAADDPWLVSGYDVGRFRFEIKTMGIAALTLQASGQEGAIHLSWQQDDFDLLAGYNLYRSNTIDGIYERINATIIPVGQEYYTDTDVTPAVPMFYKFTVVQTDLLESDFSNVASAAAVDTVPPILTHVPPSIAPPSAGLRLTATVTDNVSVVGVTIHYRPLGDTGNYTSLAMIRLTGNEYSGTIPGSAVQAPGVEYYLIATDGISQVYDGTPAIPHQVAVSSLPSLISVTPNHGPAEGGTAVTLAGTLFQAGASVFFDTALATNVNVVSPNQITCTTPPHFPAMVDVKVVNPDASEAMRLNGFAYENLGTVLSLPVTSGDYGTVVELELTASNVVGLRAADVTITYGATVLSVSDVQTGALTAGWSLSSSVSPAGTLALSLASPTEVSGSGSLARITCQVIGTPPASTDLAIASALLNDGALSCDLSHGSFVVNGFFSVTGAVTYFGGGHVPGVTLTMLGDGSYTAISDAATGEFSIADVPTGSYTLTASKTNDVAEITALDASYVLQSVVGSRTLSTQERVAADVNRNGAVSSMDASYILEKSVGLREVPFPGAGRVWSFEPEQRSYLLLNGDQSGQDFFGILLGDVSGNWTAPPSGAPLLQSPQDTDNPGSALLSLSGATGRLGGDVVLDMHLSLTDATLQSANIHLVYDPAMLDLNEVTRGAAAENMMLAVNPLPAGEIRIGLAGSEPVSEGGTLLEISFTVIKTTALPIPVLFQETEIDEGALSVISQNGSVTLVFATADLDKDGDVDAEDFQQFASCSKGPGVPHDGSPTCQLLDWDADHDIDQSDFAVFQRCYSGPNKPADPNCTE